MTSFTRSFNAYLKQLLLLILVAIHHPDDRNGEMWLMTHFNLDTNSDLDLQEWLDTVRKCAEKK